MSLFRITLVLGVYRGVIQSDQIAVSDSQIIVSRWPQSGMDQAMILPVLVSMTGTGHATR